MISSCRICRVIVGVALAASALAISLHAPSSSSYAVASPRSVEATASVGVSPAPLPAQHPFDVALYLGRPLYSVNNAKHEVALTFDDGPSSSSVPILRILKRYNAHATFFFIGDRAQGSPGPAIVSAALRAGDDLGNHTWTHVDLSGLSKQAVDDQISATQGLLEAIDGRSPTFVRPRGGKFDSLGLAEATRLGLILTLWSVDSYDTGPSVSPSTIVRRATTGVRAGSIIDLHDHHPATVAALPAILDQLRRDGLRPVTLSRLLADSTPSSVVPSCFRPPSAAIRTGPAAPATLLATAAASDSQAQPSSAAPSALGSATTNRTHSEEPAHAPDGPAAGRARLYLVISELLFAGGVVLALCAASVIVVVRRRETATRA